MENGDILPLELMARREAWNDGISIYMRQRVLGNSNTVALPVTMKTLEAGFFAEPMMTLGIQSAQQLMDELWQCGLRPTEGTGSAGSLAATERHLKDMQAIAKGLLRKDGVEAT